MAEQDTCRPLSDCRKVSVLEDEQDLRRERIETFARLLVRAYGFEGDEAERERRRIVRALDKYLKPVDYVGLQKRAKRHVSTGEIRRVLTEAGLPDREFETVLRESARRASQSARDRTGRID